MLQALASGVHEAMRYEHPRAGQIEGRPQEGWILIDYGDVVLHLFAPDRREYYQLEELWSKGKVLLRLQ